MALAPRAVHLTEETFISGLVPQWSSPGTNANNISVTSGAAWIPSLGRVYNVPSTLTAPSASLGGSAWYYIYLYDNAGTPAIELSTTAPSAVYKGTARTKTSDTSRRYLGATKADNSGTPRLYNFLRIGNKIAYRETLGSSPFRVLAGGLATTFTNISCADVVPSTCRLATVRLNNTLADQIMETSVSDSTSSNVMLALTAGSQAWADHTLDSSQNFQYRFAGAVTVGLYVDLYGYFEER